MVLMLIIVHLCHSHTVEKSPHCSILWEAMYGQTEILAECLNVFSTASGFWLQNKVLIIYLKIAIHVLKWESWLGCDGSQLKHSVFWCLRYSNTIFFTETSNDVLISCYECGNLFLLYPSFRKVWVKQGIRRKEKVEKSLLFWQSCATLSHWRVHCNVNSFKRSLIILCTSLLYYYNLHSV